MANTITYYPVDHDRTVRPRSKVYWMALLDDAMITLTVTVNGVQVFDGSVFVPGYVGTFLNEDAGKKLTLRFMPNDYWQAGTQYDIVVGWTDAGGPHSEAWDFTSSAYCFEDDYPTISTMDQAIMTGFVDSKCEKLRKLLMGVCTDSAEQFSQARTIIWLACMTEVKTILAGVLDFSLVENIHLCDRRSVVYVNAGLSPYMSLIKGAIIELKLKEEAKQLLRDYLESRSPIYAVNAVAAIVVLATRGLNL